MSGLMGERPIGLVQGHPNPRPHPANGMAAKVHLGDGAYAAIINPAADPHLEWVHRYGSPEPLRYIAATVMESYDYLLSGEISMKEAVRRLRILRQARAELPAPPATPTAPTGQDGCEGASETVPGIEQP